MKVLIATEGSEFSKAAIEKCCRMFEESENTQIRIVSAAQPALVAAEPFAVSAEYIGAMDAVATKQAESAVAEAEESIRKRCPDLAVELSTTVIKGAPAQAIVE